MVKLIMGLKGSGKTKQLVTDINEAVKNPAAWSASKRAPSSVTILISAFA